MGNIKVNDKIIIVDMLSVNSREGIIGKTAVVEYIDKMLPNYFPYRVDINNQIYWVQGIPHSSLMEELI